MDVGEIKRLVTQGRYELSKHAERERQIDMIHTWELEDDLKGCEIIENYPNDPRGETCLVLGFYGSKPVHAVCTIKADPGELLFITVYDPSKRPDKWTEDYRERR